jgi:hypothetical protein
LLLEAIKRTTFTFNISIGEQKRKKMKRIELVKSPAVIAVD